MISKRGNEMTTLLAAAHQALDALELMRYNGIKVEEWDGKALEFFGATISTLSAAIREAELEEQKYKLSSTAIVID